MSCFLLEHKSTGDDIVPGSPWWKRVIAMDPQVSIYIEGMRQVGYDVTGVLYDALHKPDLRPYKATPIEKREYRKRDGKLHAKQHESDETPEAFGRRVLEAIAKDLPRYYQRCRIVRLGNDLRESAFDSWQTGAAIREARHSGIFPRYPDSCFKWGRACEYLPICSGESDPGDPLLYRIGTHRHEELDAANRETRVVLTKSSLSCFRTCPRKYELQYVKMIRSRKIAEPLRRGTSLHHALNEWWRTGGDLEAALAALPSDDLFDRALEGAMVCGYHANWGAPVGKVIAVEQEFICDLVNPDTGARSRTFCLSGKADGVLELTDADVAGSTQGKPANDSVPEPDLEVTRG